ncbi:MAG: DEAD/DEAH box helicase, partial [Planctomycetota bacterium]
MNTVTSSPNGDAPSVVDVDAAIDSDAVTHPGADRFAAVPRLLQPALERKGFEDLTEVQRAVLDAEAEGRDLQIFSQTGSGKTVALGFVLGQDLFAPPAGRGPEALIIVPTRELATQVCEELRWLFADLPGVHLASVTGGHPVHLDRRALSREPRVLVGTPGRLLDHLNNGNLDLSEVRHLVLDEADQMLDMGFREELEGILESTNPERRTHLVSATFPEAIRRLAQRYQREPLVLEGTRLGEANADIEHTGHLVRHHERYDVLVSLLMQGDGERTLIFVERRSDALEVAERLEEDGFAALPLSGELAQGQRERTLNSFRNGQASVLVATDVAARGLDVPDVARVIHTAPPIDAQ